MTWRIAENKELREDELAKELGDHYDIFRALYPEQKLTLSDLAKKTEKDPGNLSRFITEMEELEILETEEVERPTGRPFRYVTLSQKIAPAISAISNAVKRTSPKKYDPPLVNLLLDMIDDDELDEDIRKQYAASLQEGFDATPQGLILDNMRLRKTLEATITRSEDGEVEKIKRTMLRKSIPPLVKSEFTIPWVIGSVYPKALALLKEKKPAKNLMLAMSILENIATYLPEDREKEFFAEKIRTQLRDTYFKNMIKRDSSLGGELENVILRLFTQQTETTRELISYCKKKLKRRGKEGNEKATSLLKNIARYVTHDRQRRLDAPLIV